LGHGVDDGTPRASSRRTGVVGSTIPRFHLRVSAIRPLGSSRVELGHPRGISTRPELPFRGHVGSGQNVTPAHRGRGASRSRQVPAPAPLCPRPVTGPVKVSPSGGLRPTLTGPPSCEARVEHASRGELTSVPRPTPLETGSVRWLQSNLGSYRFVTFAPIQPQYGSYFGIAEANVNDVPLPAAWTTYIRPRLDREIVKTCG
jgi:hypothetical protein